MKSFNIRHNIGSSKYVVNFWNGISRHRDGSKFFDIRIFKGKPALEAFVKILKKKGYVETGIHSNNPRRKSKYRVRKNYKKYARRTKASRRRVSRRGKR